MPQALAPIAEATPAAVEEPPTWIPTLRPERTLFDPTQPLNEADAAARAAMYAQFGPPTTPEAATRQAVQLQQEYYREKEYLPRVEIIYRLADASTPQSRGVLSNLFFAEKNPELRVQIVSALPFIDAGDLNLSIPILQEALKPTQGRDLREAAIDTIQSLNDTRTIPLLQSAATDPDPELRDTAVRTLEYLRELEQLERR